MKICIATPTSGELSTEYFFGALSCMRFPQEDAHFDFFIREGSSLLSKCRDEMVAEFLFNDKFKDHTHMVFIDSDQSFTALDVYRLASHGVDFVAAPVPYKQMDREQVFVWSNIAATGDEMPDYDAMLSATSRYNYHKILGPAHHKDLLKVDMVGTGMMCMSREALLLLTDAAIGSGICGSYEYKVPGKGTREAPALFQCMLEYGKYLGEDFSFCRRVNLCGMDMTIDPHINVTHVGKMPFEGNLTKKMEFLTTIDEYSKQANTRHN